MTRLPGVGAVDVGQMTGVEVSTHHLPLLPAHRSLPPALAAARAPASADPANRALASTSAAVVIVVFLLRDQCGRRSLGGCGGGGSEEESFGSVQTRHWAAGASLAIAELVVPRALSRVALVGGGGSAAVRQYARDSTRRSTFAAADRTGLVRADLPLRTGGSNAALRDSGLGGVCADGGVDNVAVGEAVNDSVTLAGAAGDRAGGPGLSTPEGTGSMVA